MEEDHPLSTTSLDSSLDRRRMCRKGALLWEADKPERDVTYSMYVCALLLKWFWLLFPLGNRVRLRVGRCESLACSLRQHCVTMRPSNLPPTRVFVCTRSCV